MLVLGIDPGLSRTAWGLLSYDRNFDKRPTLLQLDQITTKKVDGSTLARVKHIAADFRGSAAGLIVTGFGVYIERGIINPKQSPVAGGDINLLIGVLLASFLPPFAGGDNINFVLPQTWRTRILGAANVQCRLQHLEGIIDLADKKVRNQDQRDAIAVAYYGLMKEGVL